MNFLSTLLVFGAVLGQTQDCLTPDQDKDLKTSIMAIDATLKITVTSLNIAAMWKNGTEKAQLEEAANIITAVDTELVEDMTKIVEETCGTCTQITHAVHDIVNDLENTLTKAVPDWKNNPIYKSVTLGLNAILGVIPAFCPSESVAVAAPVYLKDECLDADQEQILKNSIAAIDGTLQLTVTSLNIAAMFKNGTQKEQLELSSKIIAAIDTELVKKLTPIVEETCGTCTEITKGIQDIVTDLENALAKSVPDWKTNPIFVAVQMGVNAILGMVPGFCMNAGIRALRTIY